MNNKEIKEKVKTMIEAQMDESGLSEEEVMETTMLSLVYEYYQDDITLEDLCAALDYLGYAYDASSLEKGKEERNARLVKRKVRKEKKANGKKQNQT